MRVLTLQLLKGGAWSVVHLKIPSILLKGTAHLSMVVKLTLLSQPSCHWYVIHRAHRPSGRQSDWSSMTALHVHVWYIHLITHFCCSILLYYNNMHVMYAHVGRECELQKGLLHTVHSVHETWNLTGWHSNIPSMTSRYASIQNCITFDPHLCCTMPYNTEHIL